jgi:DMSO reductase anchor subunit
MWSNVATVIDVFHIVLIIGSIIVALVAFCKKELRATLLYNIITSLWSLVVIIQVLCLNCPLTQLSYLLRSFDNPNIEIYKFGFVYWIVHDFLGLPIGVMAITIVSMCIAVFVLAVLVGVKRQQYR